MMEIMQGDAYNVAISLKDKDGNPIQPDAVSEVIASLGNIIKSYSDGDVQYDIESGVYYFPVTQIETLTLSGIVPFDVRVKFTTGDVKGKNLGVVCVTPTGAREVL